MEVIFNPKVKEILEELLFFTEKLAFTPSLTFKTGPILEISTLGPLEHSPPPVESLIVKLTSLLLLFH